MGNKLLKLLVIEYMVIAIAFAFQKDWGKVVYFIGAVVLSIGVLMQ